MKKPQAGAEECAWALQQLRLMEPTITSTQVAAEVRGQFGEVYRLLYSSKAAGWPDADAQAICDGLTELRRLMEEKRDTLPGPTMLTGLCDRALEAVSQAARPEK